MALLGAVDEAIVNSDPAFLGILNIEYDQMFGVLDKYNNDLFSFVLDGKEYRGHEFHYTQFLGEIPASIVQVYNAKGGAVATPVFKYKNVLASYTHLYEIIG